MTSRIMRRWRQAFTLAEVIIAAGLGGIVVAGLCVLMLIAFHQSGARQWSYTSAYGSHIYEAAPSPGQFTAASVLITEFQHRVKEASAVFVLGGFRGSPSSSPTAGRLPPLGAGILPTTIPGANSTANLRLLQTSFDIRSALGASAIWEASSDDCDFTVLTVTGLNTVSSVTQVRRFVATVDGEALALYEVVLDCSLGAARDETSIGTRNRWSYRYAVPIPNDGWTIPAGALHYWFRYDTSWARQEEGPTQLVFPDPFLLAGQPKSGDPLPFSRFVFFISPNS